MALSRNVHSVHCVRSVWKMLSTVESEGQAEIFNSLSSFMSVNSGEGEASPAPVEMKACPLF